jgi:hypothetical protein
MSSCVSISHNTASICVQPLEISSWMLAHSCMAVHKTSLVQLFSYSNSDKSIFVFPYRNSHEAHPSLSFYALRYIHLWSTILRAGYSLFSYLPRVVFLSWTQTLACELSYLLIITSWCLSVILKVVSFILEASLQIP